MRNHRLFAVCVILSVAGVIVANHDMPSTTAIFAALLRGALALLA
jgi:hypothetical protein